MRKGKRLKYPTWKYIAQIFKIPMPRQFYPIPKPWPRPHKRGMTRALQITDLSSKTYVETRVSCANRNDRFLGPLTHLAWPLRVKRPPNREYREIVESVQHFNDIKFK